MSEGKSVRHQFAETIHQLGLEDDDLMVLIGDISHGIMQPFAKACPGRFYNMGILEATMISVGAGLARSGLVPVMHTIAPFLIERGFEQIKLDFCYQQLSGNIVSVGSAFDYSNLGSTHHCYGDFALLKTLPNVDIIFPTTAVEFDALFRQAYRNDHVSYFRISGNDHGVRFDAGDIEFGKGIRLFEGCDITLIATGPQLKTAMGARETLAGEGRSVELIYIHTIRPLDEDLIRDSATKTKNLVVIEEHMQSGGLGDSILNAVQGLGDIKFQSVSIPNQFVTGYGSYQSLCESVGLTAENLSRVARRQLDK